MPSSTMELADRRTLAWSEFGAAGEWPVFVFGGRPSSRHDGLTFDGAARRHHIWLICPDRPGIGRSSAQPGRVLLDWPADVSALADYLGVGGYGVMGLSGGGPYALACGVDPDTRLRSIVVVSGCSPVDRAEVGVRSSPSDRLLGTLAVRSPALARLVMSALGTSEDHRAIREPWGFLPEEVDVPVTLWHGDADRAVALHQAQDLAARLPRAELRVVPGEGHQLYATRADAICADLRPFWAPESAVWRARRCPERPSWAAS